MMLAKGYKAALMAGVAMLALAGTARAQNNTIQGWCQVGGIKAVTQGMISSNTLQGSYPRCSVTVYLTGTSTKATLHTSATGGTLTNPFTANTDGSWLLWAANGAYDVVMVGGTPIAMPYAVTLTDVVIGAGGGGGGGCSVGGIPTTGGIVNGDSTSTNCGTNNRSGDTAGTNADVQTFGFTNGGGNSGTDVILVGENNGTGNQATDLIAIGDSNASHSGSAPLQGQHIIGIGTGTLGTSDFYGPMTASVADFIAIGNGAGSMFHSSTATEAIAIGNGAGADWIGSTNNIIGIGNAGASDHNGSNNVVGIGNGAATGSTPSGSPPTPTTNVSEVVGIGDGAAGNNNGNNVVALGKQAAIRNRGSDVIALGEGALAGYSPSTGNVDSNVIALGTSAADSSTGGGDNVILGWFAGASNTGEVNVFIGDSAGYQNTGDIQIFIGNLAGLGNHGDTVVGIGENAAGNSSAITSDFIGDNAGLTTTGWGGGQYFDCMGYDSCQSASTGSGVLGQNVVGIGAFAAGDAEGQDIAAVGNAAGGYHTSHDIVAHGHGAGDGRMVGSNSPTSGHDVVALGQGSGSGSGSNIVAIGNRAVDRLATTVGNSGSELIAIGERALTANTTGTNNVAIGQFSGANGWVSNTSLGNSNLTGSNNTWVGDFSGPSTATQLSNTIAIGANASVSASNSATYGNSSITQTDIYGTTTIHGAGTINGLDVPEGTAGSGTAGRDKLWADATSHCWMISNNGGAGACISTGGGGGTPGGANTQVQFNNSGAFGGSNLTWSGSRLALPSGDVYFGDTSISPTYGRDAQYNFRIIPSAEIHPATHDSVGLFAQVIPNFGANKPTSTVTGALYEAVSTDAFSLGTLSGAITAAYAQGSGAITDMFGLANDAQITQGSSNVGRVIGTDTAAENFGSGVVTNLIGLQTAYANGGAGSAVNGYGLLVRSPSGDGSNNSITNSFGIYIQDQDRGTNKFNFYSAGTTSHNSIEGDLKVGFGSTPSDVCTQAVPCAGAVNPATCTANSTTDICVTLAAYYASPDGLTTTTTSATFGVGTSGSIASCSTFSANNGVLITGAGAAGANYVGTVLSCSGTTLTVSPATSTSVASGAVVQHDESAAFQAAVTALTSTGGNIYIPDGTYLLNGPLQDTSGANAVVIMPVLPIGSSTVTRLIGFQRPASLAGTPRGAILKTSITSGAVFGGFCHAGCSTLSFTFAGLQAENLIALSPAGGNEAFFDTRWIGTAWFYHVAALGIGSVASGSSGILFPYAGNDVRLSSTDLYVSNFGTCVQTGEHTTILELGESDCIKGIVPTSRPGTPYAGNTQHIVHTWCQNCTYQLAAGPNVATIKIDALDIESAATNGIYDPTNLMYGTVNWNVQATAGAVTAFDPAINGAANLHFTNIQFPAVALNSRGGGLSGSIDFYNNSTTPDVSITHPLAGNLSFTGASTAGVGLYASNTTNGTGSYSFLSTSYNNDISRQFRMVYLAPGSTFGGILTPNSGYMSTSSSAAQMILNTEAVAPIVFGVNSVEKMRLQNGLCIGCTTDPGAAAIAATDYIVNPSGGTNGNISFGGNFGADAIDLYAAGSNKYGWGLNAGEMQFFLQDNSTGTHFSFNGASGGLQATGTNEFARLTPKTSGGGWTLASGEGYGFSSSTTSSATADTVLWRTGADAVCLGNGTAGNCSGTFGAATVSVTTALKTASYTVSGLPSASTVGAGGIVRVSDAIAFTVGACTGGGSDTMLAVSDGTSWTCH